MGMYEHPHPAMVSRAKADQSSIWQGMRPKGLLLAAVLGLSGHPAVSAGTVKCEFNAKTSTATVTNDNKFQSTCSWECNYKTEGNDFIHRGKSGLNPGESFSNKSTAKDTIVSLEKKSVDCGGS